MPIKKAEHSHDYLCIPILKNKITIQFVYTGFGSEYKKMINENNVTRVASCENGSYAIWAQCKARTVCASDLCCHALPCPRMRPPRLAWLGQLLTRLCGCAHWSGATLTAYGIRAIFARRGLYNLRFADIIQSEGWQILTHGLLEGTLLVCFLNFLQIRL